MSITVTVNPNEPIDKALKRFRKACEDDGLLREVRKRARYQKPSDRKRIAKREAIRKHRQALKKDNTKQLKIGSF